MEATSKLPCHSCDRGRSYVIAVELIRGLYEAQIGKGDEARDLGEVRNLVEVRELIREALKNFANVVQLLVVALFVAILGAVVHRYTEPYFILWFYGWVMWLLLYACRQVGWQEAAFNGLNSFFFCSPAWC